MLDARQLHLWLTYAEFLFDFFPGALLGGWSHILVELVVISDSILVDLGHGFFAWSWSSGADRLIYAETTVSVD